MNKSKIINQLGGWKVGQRLEMIDGPEKGTILVISRIGIKDSLGFEAAEITYSTGEIEICAIQILNDGIDGKFEYRFKMI